MNTIIRCAAIAAVTTLSACSGYSNMYRAQVQEPPLTVEGMDAAGYDDKGPIPPQFIEGVPRYTASNPGRRPTEYAGVIRNEFSAPSNGCPIRYNLHWWYYNNDDPANPVCEMADEIHNPQGKIRAAQADIARAAGVAAMGQRLTGGQWCAMMLDGGMPSAPSVCAAALAGAGQQP